MNIWDQEPVMVLQIAAVMVTIVLVVAFELTSAELALVLALLQLVIGTAARSQVTPVAKLGSGE